MKISQFSKKDTNCVSFSSCSSVKQILSDWLYCSSSICLQGCTMVPSTLQPLSIAACLASSNDIPLIVAMVVKFNEEYAFDISLITRSRTLSAKIRNESEILFNAKKSSCLTKSKKFEEHYGCAGSARLIDY